MKNKIILEADINKRLEAEILKIRMIKEKLKILSKVINDIIKEI